MSKHTPGPWILHIEETTDEGGMPIRAIDPKDGLRFRVADVYGIDLDIDRCEISEANARLIAAAPDNYACNIELAKIVRELCGIYGHPLPEASLERSDAAINKATGE